MFFSLKKIFSRLITWQVYLDHAATTPMDPQVYSVMGKIYQHTYGNPGGMYTLGTATQGVITDARRAVAQVLGTTQDHIIFTRGGTESNNLAILGTIRHFKKNNPGIVPHIITSVIEHDSVLEVVKKMEQDGEVTASYIPCDTDGVVAVEDIKEALRPETVLVSIMYANNEIGTIQPIKEIAKLLRWWKKQTTTSLFSDKKNAYPLLHTDAIQAANYCDINSLRLGVDLMTLSGSKIYGPKSVGILFVKHTDMIDPIIYGGGQEFGLRSGTEDVALIAGFAKALEISQEVKEKEIVRLTTLRDFLIDELVKDGCIHLNGSKDYRLSNNINVTIKGFPGEQLVIQLAARGFAVSAKSACQADSDEESHVIAALRAAQGVESSSEEGSLRITLGRRTTKQQLGKFIKEFNKILE